MDDIISPIKRKKKLIEKEKKEAKKDIKGEKRSLLTFKDNKSRKKK